jgi:hypothetical protein
MVILFLPFYGISVPGPWVSGIVADQPENYLPRSVAIRGA